MSVLAHVIRGSKLQDEPAATQALAFILSRKPEMVLAISQMLQIDFKPGRVAAEKVEDESKSRVDLTIHDSEGKVRILIENKFWAGLTEAQPLGYLDKLSELRSALLFIVPEKRMRTIWDELRDRCEKGKRGFNNKTYSQNIYLARVKDKNLFVTSWSYVLEQLSEKADSIGQERIKQDIMQLRGLTKQMDLDAFLPLRESEVSDQWLARRVMNYAGLIDAIIEELESRKIAVKKATSAGGSLQSAYFGRYFILHDRFLVWLGLSFDQWKKWGKSPLWLTFDKSNTKKSGKNRYYWDDGMPNYERIQKILKNQMIEKENHEEHFYTPIRLKIGAERESIVEDAVSQITKIADKLKQEYYPN